VFEHQPLVSADHCTATPQGILAILVNCWIAEVPDGLHNSFQVFHLNWDNTASAIPYVSDMLLSTLDCFPVWKYIPPKPSALETPFEIALFLLHMGSMIWLVNACVIAVGVRMSTVLVG
jgi:hypothetical protein